MLLTQQKKIKNTAIKNIDVILLPYHYHSSGESFKRSLIEKLSKTKPLPNRCHARHDLHSSTTHPVETLDLLCKNARKTLLWHFQHPGVNLVKSRLPFLLQQSKYPVSSPLTQTTKTYSNSNLDICPLMHEEMPLYIQPISYLKWPIYPFMQKMLYGSKGKEEVSGDLYLNLRPYSISLL